MEKVNFAASVKLIKMYTIFFFKVPWRVPGVLELWLAYLWPYWRLVPHVSILSKNYTLKALITYNLQIR